MKQIKRLLCPGLLVLFLIGWAASLIINHPAGAIVSFDEGFHGGIAYYVSEVLKLLTHGGNVHSLDYLRGEFNNGIIYYPPLWNVLAGGLAWIFGPSTAIFRFSTLIIGALTLGLVYWFVGRLVNQKAALLSAVVLATMPIFYIYSHLMMLEVPLAFGVALAMLAFYWYLQSEKLTWWLILLVTLAFALGVQGKIIGIAVIYTVIGLFGLALLIFGRKSQELKRFFNWPTLLFLVTAGASWYAYVWAVTRYLHADMLGFFLGQSQEQTGIRANPVVGLLTAAWEHKDFYLRDFRHYPLIGWLWLVSTLGYLITKRSLLAMYLFVWVLGSWFIFSGVSPQVPQYLIPIYVPLAIATGLFVSDLIAKESPAKYKELAFFGAAAVIVIVQGFSINNSEVYGWRAKVVNQEAAASYIAQNAATNDRVIVWSDGTIYTVRSSGYAKQLGIYNGNGPTCDNALKASTDWAIIEAGAEATTRRERLVKSGFALSQSFDGTDGPTEVYHNPNAKSPSQVEAEDVIVENGRVVADPEALNGQAASLARSGGNPNIFGCYRILPPGQRSFTFRIKTTDPLLGASSDESIAQVEVAHVGGPELVLRPIKVEDLRGRGYQEITVPIESRKINSEFEFRIRVYRSLDLIVDRVTIN